MSDECEDDDAHTLPSKVHMETFPCQAPRRQTGGSSGLAQTPDFSPTHHPSLLITRYISTYLLSVYPTASFVRHSSQLDYLASHTHSTLHPSTTTDRFGRFDTYANK